MLLALDDPEQPLSNAATVVLSALHLNAFLLNAKSNATLQQLVKGILVDPTGVYQTTMLDMSAHWSATKITK